MYFNVFGEKVSRARYREMVDAAKNRRELIAAGLTSRRDLCKMGLLTAGKKHEQERRKQEQQKPPGSRGSTSKGRIWNSIGRL